MLKHSKFDNSLPSTATPDSAPTIQLALKSDSATFCVGAKSNSLQLLQPHPSKNSVAKTHLHKIHISRLTPFSYPGIIILPLIYIFCQNVAFRNKKSIQLLRQKNPLADLRPQGESSFIYDYLREFLRKSGILISICCTVLSG